MKVTRKHDIQAKRLYFRARDEYSILQHVDNPFVMGMEFAFQTVIFCECSLFQSLSIVFILEYCPCGDLFDLLQNRNLTEDEVRFYAAELVLAIGYLHRENIMHR